MLAPRAHGRVALVATGAPADTAHGRVALVATGTPADTAHGRVALVATENGADAAHGRVALVATGASADTSHGRVALVATENGADAAATSAALPNVALPRAALPPTDDAAATSAALPSAALPSAALPSAALPQLPQRRHPSRNSVMTHLDNRAIMLYVTVVTGKRNAILADKAVQDCIVAAWKAAADWLVGRYVIMPDHIHFFCAPATYPPPDFHRWMKQWKAQVSRSFPIGLRAGRAHRRVALVATGIPADTAHGRVALVVAGNGADAAATSAALPNVALPPTDDAAATSAALPPTDGAAATSAALPCAADAAATSAALPPTDDAAAVATWDEAFAAWRAAAATLFARRGRELRRRSPYQLARWIARRRTLGALATLGQDCTVRVLERIRATLADGVPPDVERDWEVFN